MGIGSLLGPSMQFEMGKKGVLVGLGKRTRRSRHRHNHNQNSLSFDGAIESSVVLPTAEVLYNANETPRIAPDGLQIVNPTDAQSEAVEDLPRSQQWRMHDLDPTEESFADEAEDHSTEQADNVETVATEADRALLDSEPEDVDDSSQRKGQILLDSWRVLWAFILTSGSRKLTKDQYQAVRNLAFGFASMDAMSWKLGPSVTDFNEETFRTKVSVLPHYSTLQKRIKDDVLNRLAPRGFEHIEIVDEAKAGAKISYRAPGGEARIGVRTILPSEYARLDMATPDVWSEMISTSLSSARHLDGCPPSVRSDECIDVVPIVAARSWFYGQQKVMSADNLVGDGRPSSRDYAEAGDSVRVEILGEIIVEEAARRSFSMRGESSAKAIFEGVFAHSWTVHHSSRESDAGFAEEYSYEVNPRDKQIADMLNFVDYKSPTDSVDVHIPNLPTTVDVDRSGSNNADDGSTHSPEMVEALRRRRAALREQKKQIDKAWVMWEKPMIKPGDFVVLLRPFSPDEFLQLGGTRNDTLLTSSDKKSRLCVVHRFWSEREEKSRHVFFVPGGRDFGESPGESRSRDLFIGQFCGFISADPPRKYAHVQSVRLIKQHQGTRGPQKHIPVSSVGVLDNGEPYFIYRIVLFWDGFTVQSGSSASGEGVYLLCLNLPRRARSSPNAVRILSLTPPGVKSTDVLQHILTDVLKGAVEGFLDYDANGSMRRVFIDLVGVLGDTPALNSALDVLGHTGNSCCHLCRFTRQSITSIGSRYGNGVGNGAEPAFRRGFFQHAAVKDSGAQYETCRLMGMRTNVPISYLPLHAFRCALHDAKAAIHMLPNGAPVVPYHFDPYRASFIAPDHLLSGHLRDCISLVIKLLPTKECSKTCERQILSLLLETELPRQNRLIDHEKKALYTMSMTEMFALGVVAEVGFIRGCSVADTNAIAGPTWELCKQAISLVGSCASLIAEVWRRPTSVRDGRAATDNFERNFGMQAIQAVQREVLTHIERVELICSMSEQDYETLEAGRCTQARKSELAKLYRNAVTAIKCLDKPNLHRLREMVFSTLPMVGHMSLIGELVLEKAHQRLKRALKQSNNREGHIQSMKCIALDDWQGRLTLSAPGCYNGEDRSILSCIRLLGGREGIEKVRGTVTQESKMTILRALGPQVCILKELQDQGKSVLSPKAKSVAIRKGTKWILKSARNLLSSELGTQKDRLLLDNVRTAFTNDFRGSTVLFAECVVVSPSESAEVACFRSGDIVETLCCWPNDHSIHIPFMLQPNSVTRFGPFNESSAASLWRICYIIEITDGDGNDLPGRARTYVVVQPCLPLNGDDSEFGDEFWNTLVYKLKRYRPENTNTFSFGQIDRSMRKIGTILTDSDNTTGNTFLALTREKGYPPRKG